MDRTRCKRSSIVPLCLAIVGGLAPGAAMAWGDEGHRIIAHIAEGLMTPQARAGTNALLGSDMDNLTGRDFAARATWADKFRSAGGGRTSSWHFVDIELDRPDIADACYHFPQTNGPASEGPARDCIIDKIDEFEGELASKSMPLGERILAFKYLVHLIGDLHQPLHATDDHDRGGNCEAVGYAGSREDGGQSASSNLHAYWDTVVIMKQSPSVEVLARALAARITRRDVARWQVGTTRDWALESYAVGRSVAYNLGPRAPCGHGGQQPVIGLSLSYERAAAMAADVQLERAGVRLAGVLNRAFAASGR